MSDREILILAAKAAGKKIHEAREDFLYVVVPSEMEAGQDQIVIWSPFTNSGEALDLAVVLSLDIEINQTSINVYYGKNKFVGVECLAAERDMATRRAIVCAAAELYRTRYKI